ncbi:MAG: 16S rRNA (guanine(527)-N(7))-methyltransferase RsmG [Betaproteobacteria bacterium]
MTPAQALEQGLGELALEMAQPQRRQLLDYVALLEKWNRTYNLTAVREPLAMVSHHLLDSLAVLPHLPVPGERAAVADVGSGAGLPGIPLAVARPQWRVTLVEASQKKVAFLRQACIALGLGNVSVHEGRVEAWRPANLFALVISRAFADLAKFVRACAHLVAPGGVLAAMKGTYPRDELARAPAGWDCARVVRLASPHLHAERHLVLCHA